MVTLLQWTKIQIYHTVAYMYISDLMPRWKYVYKMWISLTFLLYSFGRLHFLLHEKLTSYTTILSVYRICYKVIVTLIYYSFDFKSMIIGIMLAVINYCKNTHNRFTALWILSRTTRVSWYHSPTHTYHGHQSSLICFIHLLRSMASSLFNPHASQSFSTISSI